MKPQEFTKYLFFLIIFFSCWHLTSIGYAQPNSLILNELEYFEMPGLNVMVFHDTYPEGHQSGISIIQNGERVATNGDIRLEPAPGQWQPVPKVGARLVDRQNSLVSVSCSYPHPDLNRKGFNPIIYPDLEFEYRVNVRAEGAAVHISVDLNEPLPDEWIGKVGFNLELFPGLLFGKTFYMDDQTGIFPRQLNGPLVQSGNGNPEVRPLASGQKLVIAPEDDARRISISAEKGFLQLLDGRAHHNNGWFIVRTPVPEGATTGAIEWIIKANVIPEWKYEPVIHLSQVGYHPAQKKIAVIECDLRHQAESAAQLQHILPSGELKTVASAIPQKWGRFLRYQYLTFDFSDTREPGIYQITYGNKKSNPFKIGDDIYTRHIWQPTLEYFLPVQMCHMRVNDRYRVWHGLCHMDDALMAPTDTIHFDGYRQGDTTFTKFKPLEPVPGLNIGGWHDAGDYDLRVESQAGTVKILSLIYEAFGVDYDQTTIDQQNRLVELHRPDGKPDILQQIEHGVLSVLAGYRSLGRLYRGIICPHLRQYVLLGDASVMTDNKVYNPTFIDRPAMKNPYGNPDDRLVFTEENPPRALYVAGGLAAASRALRKYNPRLATECLQTAEALWETYSSENGAITEKTEALTELILATDKAVYKNRLIEMLPELQKNIARIGWALGRVQNHIDNPQFKQAITETVRKNYHDFQTEITNNPFGVPYQPKIWGAGWEIQEFGVQQYYLHKGWPDIISADHLYHAIHFILGCHPGTNTASFASGVGSQSVLVAYGTNRAEWSYIPGGVVSGTALIRPDFPELKEWPFLWQQSEYVIGGGASNFMFLVLAADQLLKQ